MGQSASSYDGGLYGAFPYILALVHAGLGDTQTPWRGGASENIRNFDRAIQNHLNRIIANGNICHSLSIKCSNSLLSVFDGNYVLVPERKIFEHESAANAARVGFTYSNALVPTLQAKNITLTYNADYRRLTVGILEKEVSGFKDFFDRKKETVTLNSVFEPINGVYKITGMYEKTGRHVSKPFSTTVEGDDVTLTKTGHPWSITCHYNRDRNWLTVYMDDATIDEIFGNIKLIPPCTPAERQQAMQTFGDVTNTSQAGPARVFGSFLARRKPKRKRKPVKLQLRLPL